MLTPLTLSGMLAFLGSYALAKLFGGGIILALIIFFVFFRKSQP